MNLPIDLLLLNVSNYPGVPLFPYAFVQVSEVARRFGVNVKAVDLLYTPASELREQVQRLLERHRPRAIGLHLRQLDSLFVEEYRGYWERDAGASPTPMGAPVVGPLGGGGFQPVRASAELVAILRQLTDAPILLGGHGFTSTPEAVFARIAPDLAIVGEPEGLFARFDDALARRGLATIPNLMFREGDQIVTNERVNFPPAEGAEYTPEIIDDLKRFYGQGMVRQQTFSVEAIRGCPYNCYFCCEPGVKGQKVKARPIEALVADVERLVASDLRHIWMVCSELNVLGPDIALSIAESLVKLQERTGRSLRWYAFSLPSRMNVDIWRTLARSGFRGGFNTFMSLDDENLQRGRIPHRAIDAIEEYKNIEIVSREYPPGDEIRSRGTMALFLGNSYATTATIARSLRAMHEHGILETVRVPGIMVATRTFEVLEDDPARHVNTVESFGSPTLDMSLPTFEYPKLLVEHFGGRRPFERFMNWLDMTLLSRLHERSQDCSLFLANRTTPERLSRWLSEVPALQLDAAPAAVRELVEGTPEDLRALLMPATLDRAATNVRASSLLNFLVDVHGEEMVRVLDALGIGGTFAGAMAMPIYELLEKLYARFSTADAAVAEVRRQLDVEDDSLAVLLAHHLLFRRNVVLDPRYRVPLFETGGVVVPRRHLPVAPV